MASQDIFSVRQEPEDSLVQEYQKTKNKWFEYDKWEEGSRKFGTKVGDEYHFGIDYPQPSGLDIYPMFKGTVAHTKDDVPWIGYSKGNGNIVSIKHELEGGVVMFSTYSHLKHNSLKVKIDDAVSTNTLLATMGTTGKSDGVHLHLSAQVNKSGNAVKKPHGYSTAEPQNGVAVMFGEPGIFCLDPKLVIETKDQFVIDFVKNGYKVKT